MRRDALIGVVTLLAAAASPGAAVATTVQMGQIDLVSGRTVTLRLDAAATRQLTGVTIVTTRSGRLAAAPEVTGRLGAPRAGTRTLEITARPDAPPNQQYQIHGTTAGRLGGIVPVSLRVVAAPRSGTEASPSVRWNSPAPLTPEVILRKPGTYRALSNRLVDLIREAPPVSVDLGQFGGSVPPPSRGDVFDPRIVEVVTAPNTQVTGIAPADFGQPGADLVISGQELPTQVAVRLAGIDLQILTATAASIRARLPSQPVSGQLKLVRLLDNAEAVLDQDYQVVAVPKAFEGFEANAASYSWRNAYLLSLLAWLAYADPAVATEQAAHWGLTVPNGGIVDVVTPYFVGTLGTSGASGGTQALVLFDDDAVFVAFRGSTSSDYFQDWLDNDLDVAPHPANHWSPGVTLHHGFWEAMSIAYQPVLSAIAPLLNGQRKLWITGHSLGGAVALLTAFRLAAENDITPQGVHVFGAPAVGNLTWNAIFGNTLVNVHRWNLELDPVPLLLPSPAFVHVGVRNNLYANGNHVLSDPLFFVYLPGPGTLDHLTITHMSYWCRLYEELLQHEPGTGQTLPPPPALDMAVCAT